MVFPNVWWKMIIRHLNRIEHKDFEIFLASQAVLQMIQIQDLV